MDMWTDPDRWPYMAVTAHWLQRVVENTPMGLRPKLVFRTDLIGFHEVPTRHTGEHLAGAFVWVLDRIKITSKVRFFYLFKYCKLFKNL